MSKSQRRFYALLERDQRFKGDAYQFVRDALAFAQNEMGLGERQTTESEEEPDTEHVENHLTGQQLCEAIRQFAVEQYGYMAKAVLNSWGVFTTSDFGDIVYNLIDIELMTISEDDRREHFDGLFDFDEAFVEGFRITMPD